MFFYSFFVVVSVDSSFCTFETHKKISYRYLPDAVVDFGCQVRLLLLLFPQQVPRREMGIAELRSYLGALQNNEHKGGLWRTETCGGGVHYNDFEWCHKNKKNELQIIRIVSF